MLYNYGKMLPLGLVFFIVMSCTNESTTADTGTRDTTTRAETRRETRTSFDTSRSVTTISPDKYKVLSDTLNLRIMEGTYRPGDSSIMHAHPDFALYVLQGSTVELTAEDGSKQNIEFTKDMAVVLPASTHSAKNIGRNTLRLIVVEANRPRE
ncbi:MAG: hypothetical protein H0V91_10370 [Flavisolibacter sp.]|jgi:quercetin dioxygenase-like cupin family protein|nr:hypothetical protein [Flavisolibacter sp.]